MAKTEDFDCDVAVIGAGTAGLSAEHAARRAGASTRLIDPEFSGTTCATVGCMPSKLLIAAADAAHAARKAEGFGISTNVAVDGAAVMRRLRAERDHFVSAVKSNIADLPEDVCIRAKARFVDRNKLRLDDGTTISAGAVVVATGARPAIPDEFASVGHLSLTNESLFELEELPESVGVIGAGPLGLELAQALSRLGVRVEVFEQSGSIAGLADQQVSDVLHRALSQEFTIRLRAEISISSTSDGVTVSWRQGQATFARLLVAVGRPPVLDGLDLAEAGLTLDDKGMPEFDPQTLQCGDAPIFMAGDANGFRPVLHEATAEGEHAGHNAACWPDVAKRDCGVNMAVVFTRPGSATIGTPPDPEDDEFVMGEASYADQGRARIEQRDDGLVRIYAHRQSGKISAASLCAPEAEHLTHLLAWSVGQTASDLLARPFYHPTLEEGLKDALRTIRNAAG